MQYTTNRTVGEGLWMNVTVRKVTDWLGEMADRPSATVDTLKSGNPDVEVRKVWVVFMATFDVIRQAAEAGVDLIVTHEPTFYNHKDESDWFDGDPVYAKKRALIEQSGIAIYRCHDAIHAVKPDGILIGMLRKLGWEVYADPADPNMLTPPAEERHTVRSIAAHLKEKLGIDSLLAAGDPDMPVARFALLPGATGGRRHIDYLGRRGAELLIVGETNEWETNEYVRDASDMGLRKALLVIGHQRSEEAGMTTVAQMLSEAFPGLEVTLVETPPAVRLV